MYIYSWYHIQIHVQTIFQDVEEFLYNWAHFPTLSETTEDNLNPIGFHCLHNSMKCYCYSASIFPSIFQTKIVNKVKWIFEKNNENRKKSNSRMMCRTGNARAVDRQISDNKYDEAKEIQVDALNFWTSSMDFSFS